MGKLKPYIFGVILGAGVACVALQFHLVRSHEGFRLVPRTPQPSIGLAYADIRNWSADEWADRPELARALVAHGSTDLVATSVSGGLMETISAEGSTLDKLRGLMNDTTEGFGEAPGAGQPGLLKIPRDIAPLQDSDNLFSVPFADEARRAPMETTTSLDDFSVKPATSVAQRELPSIDDILGAGTNGMNAVEKPVSEPFTTADPEPARVSATNETERLEELLFGDDAFESEPTQVSESGFGFFEDISSEVQRQTDSAVSRVRTQFGDPAAGLADETSKALDRFARDSVRDVLPDSAASMFRDDGAGSGSTQNGLRSDLLPALDAIRNGYDPFVR